MRKVIEFARRLPWRSSGNFVASLVMAVVLAHVGGSLAHDAVSYLAVIDTLNIRGLIEWSAGVIALWCATNDFCRNAHAAWERLRKDARELWMWWSQRK